jgi:hypothetical protein
MTEPAQLSQNSSSEVLVANTVVFENKNACALTSEQINVIERSLLLYSFQPGTPRGTRSGLCDQ